MSVFVSSTTKMEKLIIKNLEKDVTYRISIGSMGSSDTDDIGFGVYNNYFCTKRSQLLLQDTAGKQDEEQIFTPSEDGDYFLGIWMNGDDFGFVLVSAWEDGNVSNTVTIEELPYIYTLTWLWITLGVVVIFTIFSFVIVITISVKSKKRHQAKVVVAIETGVGLPRFGRKKDKCPFCKVKLPPEYQPKCPYCGAPITVEE